MSEIGLAKNKGDGNGDDSQVDEEKKMKKENKFEQQQKKGKKNENKIRRKRRPFKNSKDDQSVLEMTRPMKTKSMLIDAFDLNWWHCCSRCYQSYSPKPVAG